VRPARETFDFSSPEEFEERASDLARRLAPRLEGKGFFVRVHLRGFPGRLSAKDAERLLGSIILHELEHEHEHEPSPRGPGRITFEDPDAVLSVDTVGDRTGMSLWGREELRRYSFLGLL
jgi:tRNA(Ser,Leu) C12 N-acetylase TAN1